MALKAFPGTTGPSIYGLVLTEYPLRKALHQCPTGSSYEEVNQTSTCLVIPTSATTSVDSLHYQPSLE